MPTVDVPDNAYTTISDVTSALGGWSFPAGFSADDQQRAVIEAKQSIDQALNTTYGRTSINVECDGSGNAYLGLSHFTTWPLYSITQILYRSSPSTAWASASVVDAGTYAMAHSRRGVERVYGDTIRTGGEGGTSIIWIRGTRNYRVDAVFGADEIPESIRRAAILLVRERAEPGYTDKYEATIRERWPDGYEIDRTAPRSSQTFNDLTGYRAIDALLQRFVVQPIGLLSIE